jgi:hypothetical protein
VTVDPGSRGWNEHTHVTVERPTDELIFTSPDTTEDLEPLLHIPAGSQSLCMHVPEQYAMVSSKGGTHLGGNAYWDGTNWLHFDNAQAHTLWVVGPTNATLYGGPAGAGPAVNTVKFQIDSATGNVNVKGALIAEAAASVTGTLTAGAVSTPNISWTSRAVSTVSSSYGVAGLPGGTGPFEIGVTGGGAAQMAFHRHGYYAAHFGIDTDNIWKVGGWSMGASAHTLWHSGNAPISQGASGGTLVQRTAAGYIYANYINLSADVPGGAPAYVAGNNGDGFLRWWPRGNLIPGLTQVAAQARSPQNMSWVRAATTWVNHTGYWLVIARSDSRDASRGGNSRCGVMVVINGANGGTTEWHANLYGGAFSAWPLEVYWIGVMSNGQEVGVNVFNKNWDDNEARDSIARVDAYFIPTPGYMD